MEEKFIVTHAYSGQASPYKDYLREWYIKTDATKEETIEYCFNNLYMHRLPSRSDWEKGIGINCPSDYWAGYYYIDTISGGYRFTICQPNTN